MSGVTYKLTIHTPMKVVHREMIKFCQPSSSEVPNHKTNFVPIVKFKEIVDEETRPKWISSSVYCTRSRKYDRIETEYVSDEEDITWLEKVNQVRASFKFNEIPTSLFEQMMGTMEAESYFEVKLNKMVGEETICCICKKQSSETMLSCYMCSLKVHKQCYGVMFGAEFIGDDKWFCRRCFFSPSIPVDCIFCPSKHGAYIPTEHYEWAHVLCAFWIPGVYFNIKIVLDKVVGIEKVKPAFGKSKCYICLEQIGVCVQCSNKRCYNSFHVSCAQEADLIEKTEIGPPTYSAVTGLYCHRCQNKRETWRQKIKIIRDVLMKKKNTLPVIVNHTVPPETVETLITIAQMKFSEIKSFIDDFTCYWFNKRKANRGVPLINSLQSSYNVQFTENDYNSFHEIEKSKTNECSQGNIIQLEKNLSQARIFLNLCCFRGELEKQLIKTKRIFIEDILYKFNSDRSVNNMINKLSDSKIMIDKIEKSLVENWKYKPDNLEEMIPAILISDCNVSKQFEGEIEKIKKIISQNETLLHETMMVVKNGIIKLDIPFSVPRIPKNPENLGRPVDRRILENLKHSENSIIQNLNNSNDSTNQNYMGNCSSKICKKLLKKKLTKNNSKIFKSKKTRTCLTD